MIKVITKSTDERKNEMVEKWKQYKQLWYNTSLTSKEIFKRLDVTIGDENYKYIQRLLRKEPVSSHSRAKAIQYGSWLQ